MRASRSMRLTEVSRAAVRMIEAHAPSRARLRAFVETARTSDDGQFVASRRQVPPECFPRGRGKQHARARALQWLLHALEHVIVISICLGSTTKAAISPALLADAAEKKDWSQVETLIQSHSNPN